MPVSSVERPVSALRQRMLEDMAMRGLRSDTQHEYIRFVRSFAAFLGQPPDTATAEDLRRFQVHQRESGVQPPTINCFVSALHFFFTVTLDRPELSRRLVLARYPRKLPTVLSVEEVGQLLEAAPGIKYKAILGTAYGAGLRVSEVASLKVDDIDSTRICRGTAARACRSGRTTRLAAALSLLRRPHDHHRDLRAMQAAPRATSRTRINREHLVVTRHGLRLPHAATPKLRRMPPGTPFAQISANVLHASRRRDPDPRSAWRKISPTKLSPSPAQSRFRNDHGPSKLEIPIDHLTCPCSSDHD